MPWNELLRDFGPLVGVILFFIWRDWKREDTLTARVESLDKYQRETLVSLVERSTSVISQNVECFKWVCRVMERVCNYLPQLGSDKPQILDE